jgi:hypothetical protein
MNTLKETIMRKFISTSLQVLALLSAIAPSIAMAGTWVVEHEPLGPGYLVTDHETGAIHTKGKRAANRVAKILNKATGGFVDPGSGPCHNPAPGTQC